MKSIAPGIEQWSCFSEEKQMDFNGLALTANDQSVIMDPPPINAPDKAQLLSLAPTHIVLINRDHTREAEVFRTEFKIPIYAPEADAPQMEIAIDTTYAAGGVAAESSIEPVSPAAAAGPAGSAAPACPPSVSTAPIPPNPLDPLPLHPARLKTKKSPIACHVISIESKIFIVWLTS